MLQLHPRLVGSMVVASLVVVPSVSLAKKTVVTVWQPWGGVLLAGLKKCAETFSNASPDYTVRIVQNPSHETNDKLMTAIAAGAPPDATFLVGFQVAEWADTNVIMPLDAYLAKSKVKADDFFKAAWKRNVYNGKVYAMTFCADTNFGIGFNKVTLANAGMPPKTPVTVAELEEYNAKLTVRNVDGKIVETGLIPYNCYGNHNALRTWSWVFGGDMVDDKAQKVTLNSPKVVAALSWLTDFVKKNPSRSMSLGSGDAFAKGKTAMAIGHSEWGKMMRQTFPKLDFGVGRMPYYSAADKDVEWIGGWCIAVPRNAKNRDGAWQFVKWLTATPEGTKMVGELTGFFSGYKANPFLDKASADPVMAPYVDILRNARNTYYSAPIESSLSVEVEKAVADALALKKEPQVVLDEANRVMQAKWNRVIARRKK